MLYFAYGSNLLPEQVAERVPGAKLLGVAQLPGWQFGYFRRSRRWAPGGAADIKPAGKKAHLWGALWRLPGWEEMDRWEGVDRRAYRRIAVEVRTAEGLVAAESYTACDKFPEVAPRDDYWQRLFTGGQQVGLPEDYLLFLQAHYQRLVADHRPQ
jgi:hypothetical protein